MSQIRLDLKGEAETDRGEYVVFQKNHSRNCHIERNKIQEISQSDLVMALNLQDSV